MKFTLIFSVSLFVFVASSVESKKTLGIAYFKLTKMEMCDPSVDYPLKLVNEIRTEGDKQFLTGTSIFKVNFGEDSDYNITINMKNTKASSEFSPLLNFYEEDTCAAIEKYLGDFVNDLEGAAGIEPGKCPIPKGSYSVTDYPLDFKKIAYQSVPEGVLQAVQVITNKKTKQVLLCMIAEGENLPNSS